MSEILFLTALMMWALAAMVTIAGFYLIRKINDMEKRLQEVEDMGKPISLDYEGTITIPTSDHNLEMMDGLNELVKEAEEK